MATVLNTTSSDVVRSRREAQHALRSYVKGENRVFGQPFTPEVKRAIAFLLGMSLQEVEAARVEAAPAEADTTVIATLQDARAAMRDFIFGEKTFEGQPFSTELKAVIASFLGISVKEINDAKAQADLERFHAQPQSVNTLLIPMGGQRRRR